VNAMVPDGFTTVVHAAGGLVWRKGAGGLELLLVRRARYGEEWSLPKGKLKAGESWEQGAIRETEEETGCRVELLDFAGGQVYKAGGRPKAVLYWHMKCLGKGPSPDPDEIVERIWISPSEALARLTYPREQRMLEEILAEGAPRL